MNILVTINSHYIKPLKVMLKSLFLNNQDDVFHIYLMHSSLKEEQLSDLDQFIAEEGHRFNAVTVQHNYFEKAPILKHYTKEMYYRLLAFKYLPTHLNKILYLDPDILVINEIRTLYSTDISDYLYAAAYHDRMSVTEINKLRLKPYKIEAYYNSGVLLMNLRLQREAINEQDIYDFVEENKKKLFLPDQDIINALYAKEIKNIDEIMFNYDARFYRYYKIVSNGKIDMDYIIRHTSIIHFCGKKKPWHKNYTGNFHSLYKHYEKLALS